MLDNPNEQTQPFVGIRSLEADNSGWQTWFVDEVVPGVSPIETAEALAEKFVQMPPLALGMVKELLCEGLESDLDTHVRSEAYAASILLKTEDFQ